MIESFLFIAFPYVALAMCIGGAIYRARAQSLSYSALSSQFLEGKSLIWGSLPWHIGIILVLLAHFIALFMPGFWQALVSYRPILLTIETVGIALGTGCLVGLVVLLIRRVTSARVQAVTSPMDLIVLVVLLLQVALGVGIAMSHRWGAIWCTGTMTPYIWSILTLQPDTSYIKDLPFMAKAHIVGAWVFILLIPFSRLIHMFALPIHYLFRPPQNVMWNNPRHLQALEETVEEVAGRRYFLKGWIALGAGAFLLSIGAVDKVFKFFFGPRLTGKQESELMSTRVQRLQATVEQRKFELERQQSNYILVAPLSELSATDGKYFIDYDMRPGLAFKGKDGLPNLLSAQCTHLGCTVGNQVNAEGKILCPCHVSYFDVNTGAPSADAPAKTPLPHLSWVLMNPQGKILISGTGDGVVTGATDPKTLVDARVYIVKHEGATA